MEKKWDAEVRTRIDLKYFHLKDVAAYRRSLGGRRGMLFQTGIKSVPDDTQSHPARDQGRRDHEKFYDWIKT